MNAFFRIPGLVGDADLENDNGSDALHLPYQSVIGRLSSRQRNPHNLPASTGDCLLDQLYDECNVLFRPSKKVPARYCILPLNREVPNGRRTARRDGETASPDVVLKYYVDNYQECIDRGEPLKMIQKIFPTRQQAVTYARDLKLIEEVPGLLSSSKVILWHTENEAMERTHIVDYFDPHTWKHIQKVFPIRDEARQFVLSYRKDPFLAVAALDAQSIGSVTAGPVSSSQLSEARFAKLKKYYSQVKPASVKVSNVPISKLSSSSPNSRPGAAVNSFTRTSTGKDVTLPAISVLHPRVQIVKPGSNQMSGNCESRNRPINTSSPLPPSSSSERAPANLSSPSLAYSPSPAVAQSKRSLGIRVRDACGQVVTAASNWREKRRETKENKKQCDLSTTKTDASSTSKFASPSWWNRVERFWRNRIAERREKQFCKRTVKSVNFMATRDASATAERVTCEGIQNCRETNFVNEGRSHSPRRVRPTTSNLSGSTQSKKKRQRTSNSGSKIQGSKSTQPEASRLPSIIGGESAISGLTGKSCDTELDSEVLDSYDVNGRQIKPPMLSSTGQKNYWYFL